jgi:hypothetical protein
MGWITGVPIFAWKVFVLFVVLPVTVVIYTLRFIAQLLAWSPYFFALLLLWGIGSFAGAYGNVVISEVDYFMRCVVHMAVENFIGPLLNLIRTAYNPSICVWDALNWFVFGYFNNVVVPDAIACGAAAVLVNIGCVATQLFDSLVVYLATGRFLTGFYDMSKLSAAMVQLIDSWIVLLCCLCQDLCCLVKVVPFVLPLPPPLMVLLPAMSTQYEFWQSIESLINCWAAICQILWPLIINLLNFTSPQNRPDYTTAASYLCQFFERFNVALEGALQRTWNTFIPWRFNFDGVLAWNSSIMCIAVDSLAIVLTVATNVDIVVFNMFTPWPNTYIGPPYTTPLDLWHTTIEHQIVVVLNTWAPTTDPAFRYDVSAINRTTVVQGLCTVVTRIVCDWNGNDTPCFNTDPDFANQTMNNGFLAGYNWCCPLTTAITTINDLNVVIYSFWLHTTSAADWFGWLDTGPGPGLFIVANDIAIVADCIFSLVDAVPVVGYCLKQVFAQLVRFLALVGAFSIRVLCALVTIIWDFLNGLESRNFLFDGDTAITEWEGIIDILMAQTPSSLLNCLKYILNYGIQIPYITLDANGQYIMCGPPQCVPVDYIPPPPIIARGWPDGGHVIDLHPGYSRGSKDRLRVTPLLFYASDGRNDSDPIFDVGRGRGAPVPRLPDAQHLIQEQRQAFYAKYQRIQECQANDLYKRQLRRDNPWRFKLLTAQNKLPDTSHCLAEGAYDNVYPGKDRREQRRILLASAESFDIVHTWAPPDWWPDRLELPQQHQEQQQEHADDDTPLPGEWIEDPSAPGEIRFVFWDEVEGTSGSATPAPETVSSSSATASPPLPPEEGSKSERIIPPPPPLTSRPTNAPIAGCPPPGDPPNPCFDLACFPASVIQTVGTILLMIGHMIDGLIRGNFPAPGEVQWGYWTGGNCPERCLENDIINLVTYSLDSLICTCRLIELILPSSPQFPQPDFCCALTTAADFITNTIQVIINSIRSLALDSPQFIYFNNGYFVRDIDVLFAELLQIVLCLCQFVRYVFPITQLTGGTIYGGGAFDLCCIPMVLVDTGIEVTHLIILSIINLATLYGAGQEFWQFTPSQPDLRKIGFLVQVDVVLETFFGSPGGICANQGRPQGIGGITSCICQIVALLFPIRQNPGAPISETNCPTVDLCCPIRDGGYLAKDILIFTITAIAGLWQSWDPAANGHCDPGWLQPGQSCSSLPQEPYAFLDFVFCNELTPWELAHLPLTPVEMQQQAKCGKALPIIALFVEIVSTCPCEFLALADAWLALYFHGWDCFCGPVDGFFTNFGQLVGAITTSIVTLVRRINDLSYWQPFGQPSPNGGPNQFNEHNTWTWEFFGPIFDTLCNTLVAGTCFLDILLPFCTESRRRIIESLAAWIEELIVRVGAFIEGIVGIFTVGSKCSDPGQTCAPGSPMYGVSVAQLADIFVSLAGWGIDALIADSGVVCSVLNPPQCPMSDLCCCYSNPQSGVLFIHVTTPPVFSDPNYQCAQCLDLTCSTYDDSYAFRTCTVAGSPTVPCFNDTLGGTGGLPSCSMVNSDLTKVDGTIMSILKYFQCVLTQLVPAAGQVIQGLVVMVSVVWQLANAILRLLASIIMFLFGLFIAVSGGVPLLQVPSLVLTFLNIFTALSQVFSQGPIIPQQVNFRREVETRIEYRDRVDEALNNNVTTAADMIALMMGVIWDYSTDDCMTNFTACACRNGLPRNEELCAVVMDGHRRGIDVPSQPVLTAVALTMQGSTFCDHHVRDSATTALRNGGGWESLWPSDKAYYIECADKMIQGGRLNDISPMVPADLFYRHEAPLMFWDNIRFSVGKAVEENHEEILREREEERKRNPRLLEENAHERQWRSRQEYMARYVAAHPRWRKSMVTRGLLRIDQFEYKLRSGYYMPMIAETLHNLERKRLPRVSVRERFSMLWNHVHVAGSNLWSIQYTRAAVDIYQGMAAISEAYQVLSTKSWWSLYWDAVERAHKTPHVARRRAAGEARREIVRVAMRKSPLYRWWYNVSDPETEKRGAAKFPRVNPLTRLWDHLKRVFAWQRTQWNSSSTPTTFVNMDLHMRQGFAEWFEQRWSVDWTPEITANWASAGRIYYRMKERIWPGTVPPEVKERFSVGPFCNVSWNKRADSDFANGIGPNCTNGTQMMRDIQESSGVWERAERMDKKRGFIVGGNCLLADGFIDELVFLTTYCTRVYMPQLPPFMLRSLMEPNATGLGSTLIALATRPHAQYHDDALETWSDPNGHETEDDWDGWATWLQRRSLNWVRSKMKPHRILRSARATWRSQLTQQQWLRATATGSFDLFKWLLGVIDSIFGTQVGMAITNWIDDLKAWFENPNEDYMAGPVGFTYWVKFWVRCEFQPRAGTLPSNAAINLNCKVGIGLESAIGWVTLYLVGIYIVVSIFLSPLTVLFSLIPVTLLWLIIVPAVAWHYSPRCWLMTPSLLIPGEGAVGITIPYWPFPIAFPALPFCLMDDITALVFKYTSMCWCQIWWGTPLEFLCPPYAVLGNPCPPCPGRIALYNCNAIGLGGGIDDFIFLGIQWFPNFANWVSGFAQIVFLSGHFGETLAQIGDYLIAAVDRFTDIPADKQSLYWWCFGYTSLSMAGPLLFFIITWLTIAFLWSIFVLAIAAIWGALEASPFFWIIPGASASNAYDSLGNNAQYQSDLDAYIQVEVQTDPVGRRMFVPVRHQQQATSLLFASFDKLWARAVSRIGYEHK